MEARDPSESDGDVAHGGSSFLRYAAQPDVVLSQERDMYYANTLLGEGASELAETLLGSRRVMILAPELRALASCLYFGLTNLAGKQTLGQEYCGVDLAASGGGTRGTSTSSKTPLRAYTFVRVAVPYLQERMREGWDGLRSLRDPLRSGGAAAALAAARARARARAAALAPPVGIAVASGGDETAANRAELEEGPGEREAPMRTAGGTSPRRAGNEAGPLTSRRRRRSPPRPFLALVERPRRFLEWARRRRPAMSGVLEWALRLHLAAFYFDGRFANPAMRAVGARLAYVRHDREAPRARYAVLGLLLLLQLAAEAASASAETVERWRATAEAALSGRLWRRTGAEARGPEAEGGDIRLGEEKSDSMRACGFGPEAPQPRVPAVAPQRTPADAALFPTSRRRCSLCMSNRQHAAATPCGHLFCWECIVGWCQTNPECPLCRQPATPQSIVCLYQYA